MEDVEHIDLSKRPFVVRSTERQVKLHQADLPWLKDSHFPLVSLLGITSKQFQQQQPTVAHHAFICIQLPFHSIALCTRVYSLVAGLCYMQQQTLWVFARQNLQAILYCTGRLTRLTSFLTSYLLTCIGSCNHFCWIDPLESYSQWDHCSIAILFSICSFRQPKGWTEPPPYEVLWTIRYNWKFNIGVYLFCCLLTVSLSMLIATKDAYSIATHSVSHTINKAWHLTLNNNSSFGSCGQEHCRDIGREERQPLEQRQ